MATNFCLKNIYNRIRKSLRWHTRQRILSFMHIIIRFNIYREIKNHRNKIYLFCVPVHPNLGDQAQLYCWQKLLLKWYPSHKLVEIPQRDISNKLIKKIKRNVSPNDIFLIHSGYLIFDPHPNLPSIIKLINFFQNRRFYILPQTVNITNDITRKILSDCFNSHPDLTLFCRDEVSYDISKKLFPKVRLKLLPDVVTSLIGNYNPLNKYRSGVLLCIRNDGEKLYTDLQINELKNKISSNRVVISDTTITDADELSFVNHREQLIFDYIKFIASFQVVITDRFHGTIFSQIASTPTIVISSADHKLSSGVKWFPKEVFNNTIFFAKDLDEAYNTVCKILTRELYPNAPNYFTKKYWERTIL